jgi:hypothetical protein
MTLLKSITKEIRSNFQKTETCLQFLDENINLVQIDWNMFKKDWERSNSELNKHVKYIVSIEFCTLPIPILKRLLRLETRLIFMLTKLECKISTLKRENRTNSIFAARSNKLNELRTELSTCKNELRSHIDLVTYHKDLLIDGKFLSPLEAVWVQKMKNCFELYNLQTKIIKVQMCIKFNIQ